MEVLRVRDRNPTVRIEVASRNMESNLSALFGCPSLISYLCTVLPQRALDLHSFQSRSVVQMCNCAT